MDPGWPALASWDGLVAGLASLGTDVEDVAGVLVSHAHTDHHGLAERVRRASGCWVGMHEADAAMLAGLRDGTEVAERNESWPDSCGVPDDERADLAFDPVLAARIGALEPDLLVVAGRVDVVVGRHLEARHTPGHTPGHLCFLLPDDRLLMTGDAVLPRITSHVGTYRPEDGDVLGTYLSSLRDLEVWAGGLDPEILPGHEYRFRGLAARLGQSRDHHAAREAEVLDVVADAGSPTAWEVAERLTWSRSWPETRGNRRRLAVAETLAHLLHAEATGSLTREPGPPLRWHLNGGDDA